MSSVLRTTPAFGPGGACAGPAALLIACLDAYFDNNPLARAEDEGLLVLRAAANEVPPYDEAGGELASAIEGAVADGVGDLIVCGHTCCSALKLRWRGEANRPGTLGRLEPAASGRMMERPHRSIREAAALRALAEENVLTQLETLRTYPTVAAALGRGRLRLHGWIYLHEAGVFLGYDEGRGRFGPFSGDAPPVPG